MTDWKQIFDQILMITSWTLMMIIWVYVAFFPLSNLSTDVSGNRPQLDVYSDHSWTHTVISISRDHMIHFHQATSLGSSAPCHLVEIAENAVRSLLPWERKKGGLFNENWSPNKKTLPSNMILFGISGGQPGNNLKIVRNLNEYKYNLCKYFYSFCLKKKPRWY